ncbi:MAG: hypothetical protein JSW33_04550 [bacterium]|nr:MAG: hypothetical protein JSW33_04550 [bacterium]
MYNEDHFSIGQLEQLIQDQTERVNIGTFWFIAGLFFILIGLHRSLELASLGIGTVLFGLEKIINGNSLRSRYSKILSQYYLPAEIDCLKCGNNLELDLQERVSGKYFCPFCNQTFRFTIEPE